VFGKTKNQSKTDVMRGIEVYKFDLASVNPRNLENTSGFVTRHFEEDSWEN